MSELLSDIRGVGNADTAMAREIMATYGYVVASDSSPKLDLVPEMRTEVLAGYAGQLETDKYGVPPVTRKRLDGLVGWERSANGLVTVTRDFPAVPIVPRSYTAEDRIYDSSLRVLGNKTFTRWMQSLISIAPQEVVGDTGTIYMHLFETGAPDESGNIGKIVEEIHRDDELLVGSYVQHFNGEGAWTSLHIEKPDTSGKRPPIPEDFDEIAKFRLSVGDLVVSHDVSIWHYVSEMLKSSDGSAALRRAFTFNFNKPETSDWLYAFFSRS